ncbi:FAD:protein FMN transferase [Tahibacter amnicola]|uniref:FAD:protein FMN transferase n=1 Tax=Tahibacter amnicola TaxID=2976241 RepID=A0ABY6BL72_9GAMM|nr:FAD:protein FMN transferase [Tahibacter amnicola]UXI70759.1 FAD:protein FMN transferase [Tahibacter amnicola]
MPWMVALVAATVLGTIALWIYKRPAVQSATFVVFGGITQVQVRGATAQSAADAFGEIGQRLRKDHDDWHAWDPSELTRLNAGLAAGRTVRVSESLAGLIREAQRGYVLSEGLFNPAIGRLIALWGFHTSNFPILSPAPTREQLNALWTQPPRMDELQISADGNVKSSNPLLSLDLNALAEGYAADQIAAILARHGIRNALINVGGDVLALGDADGRPWRVGIRASTDTVFAGAELRGHEALFSSGSYAKWRAVDGQRWGHVLDPRTGEPAHGAIAVSVIHPSAVTADITTTSVMVGGVEAIPRLAKVLGVACVVLVTEDGTTWISPAMRARLHFTEPPKALRETPDLGKHCDGSERPADTAASTNTS